VVYTVGGSNIGRFEYISCNILNLLNLPLRSNKTWLYPPTLPPPPPSQIPQSHHPKRSPATSTSSNPQKQSANQTLKPQKQNLNLAFSSFPSIIFDETDSFAALLSTCASGDAAGVRQVGGQRLLRVIWN
jgi:hypothetical protein